MAKTKKTKEKQKMKSGAKSRLKSEKKKVFRKIERGKVYIQSSFNNVIMTLTDDAGNTIGWVSAGALGFKGTKKSTPYTATLVGKAMADKIRGLGISELQILISGVGQGRDSATRALVTSGANINLISDITPLPHNGCRPKKPRRV